MVDSEGKSSGRNKETITTTQEINGTQMSWRLYWPKKNPLPVLSLTDPSTGIELSRPLRNPYHRIEAIDAWAAARHSRSPLTTEQIIDEMGMKGVDGDEKLEETFRNYGHASVADGAILTVHLNNTPMHLPMAVFNTGRINSGQEKSTRYQKSFGGSSLQPLSLYVEGFSPALEEQYQGLATTALDNFAEARAFLTEAFTEHFRPENKKEQCSLDSRVLDAARGTLLMGFGTGFAFKTSARDWSRIISLLKAAPMELYHRVGFQTEAFLAPDTAIEEELGFVAEAPSLVRHSHADHTANTALSALQSKINTMVEYVLRENLPVSEGLEGVVLQRRNTRGVTNNQASVLTGSSSEHAMTQYVLSLFPGADWEEVRDALTSSPREFVATLSDIMYGGHNHHRQLPVMAETSDMAILFDAPVSVQRDFNRHRQWGRFIQGAPLLFGPATTHSTASQIVSRGYGLSAYLTDIAEMRGVRIQFESLMNKYYKQLDEFIQSARVETGDENMSFVHNLLPLAHKLPMIMHGTPSALSYLTSLRQQPGGDITYRVLAFDAAQEASRKDPFISGLELPTSRPDPANRAEFYDRS